MSDIAPLTDALEAAGPTNHIARALLNRLELAEDRVLEAQLVLDELAAIVHEVENIAERVYVDDEDALERTVDAFERGIARLEAEADDETNRP